MAKLKKRDSIYSNFRSACESKGTNITRVLKECGRTSGNTGAWKVGTFPRLDVVMDIAEHIGVSLDELCYGLKGSKAVLLDEAQREWLEIASRIPEDRRQMCMDFLETHAIIPSKYEKGKKTS